MTADHADVHLAERPVAPPLHRTVRAPVTLWTLGAAPPAPLQSHTRWREPRPQTWQSLLASAPPDLFLVENSALAQWPEVAAIAMLSALEEHGTVIRVASDADADVPALLARFERVPSEARRFEVPRDALPLPAHRRLASLLTTDQDVADALAPKSGKKSAALPLEVASHDHDDESRPAAGGYRAQIIGRSDNGQDVLAAAAAGTPLFAAREVHERLASELQGYVTPFDDPTELRGELVAYLTQDELLDRKGHQLRRAVARSQGQRAQASSMLAGLGLAPDAAAPTVSAVVPTNRSHQLDNILANIGCQVYPRVELVLVLHGIEAPADLERRAAEAGVQHLVVVTADPATTLGTCMNLGVDAAGGEFIAKMDDDNIYGPEFISDLVDAADMSGAEIVGKWAHYVWLRSIDAVVLRYPDSEHRFERRIQGGSMLFAGDLVRDLRFSDIPRAVDSDILDRARAAGSEIYSADRFNFVSVRESDPHQHTWTVADVTFFTRLGRLVFYGDPRAHVTV